jgi:hypothetical protein
MSLREKNGIIKVYTQNQFVRIQNDLLVLGGELDFRLRLDLLLAHFMLLRSSNRLQAQLGDLFTFPHDYESPSGPVRMLYLLLRRGKVFPLFHTFDADLI